MISVRQLPWRHDSTAFGSAHRRLCDAMITETSGLGLVTRKTRRAGIRAPRTGPAEDGCAVPAPGALRRARGYAHPRLLRGRPAGCAPGVRRLPAPAPGRCDRVRTVAPTMAGIPERRHRR